MTAEARGRAGVADDVARAVATATFDVSYVMRLDGLVEWVSPSLVDVLGLDPQTIVGTRPWDLVHPDDLEAASRAFREASESGAPLADYRIRLRHADGGYRWLAPRARALTDESGALTGFVVSMRDVDAEVRTEFMLAESEARYRLIAENVHDVVYLAGLDRRVRWVSPAVERVLGWPQEELIGSIVADLVHPDDRARTDPDRDELYRGQPTPVDADGAMRVRRRDGTYIWMSGAGSVVRDDDGAPTGVVGSFHDVDSLVRARAAASAGEEALQATLDSMLDPCVLVEDVRDADGAIVDLRFVSVNDAACAYAGSDRDALVGQRMLRLFPAVSSTGEFGVFVTALESGDPLVLDDHRAAIGPDGRRLDIRATRSPRGLVITWRDVTERAVRRERLAASEQVYRLVTDESWDGVLRTDASYRITWVSPSLLRLTGHDEADLIGTDAAALTGEAMARAARAALAGGPVVERMADTELLLRTTSGHHWCRVRTRPIETEDGFAGWLHLVRDVEAEVLAAARLEHERRHDPLTGLATWAVIGERIAAVLRRSSGRVALLCVGVDRLTGVNEAYSYAGGDEVLRWVAERLADVAGSKDDVARVAGDEFALVVTGLDVAADAVVAAERVREVARGAVAVRGDVVQTSVTVGIAVAEIDSTAEGLLRLAGLAMRRAKASGRDRWELADPALADEAAERLRVESVLRDGLAAGRVVPFFQPVVDLEDRGVVGVEALARLLLPEGGLLPPDAFLGVAERAGLVVDLDLAVLERALAAAQRFPGHVGLAANIAAPTLSTPELDSRVLDLLARFDVQPHRLILEVTETMLHEQPDDVHDVMASLAAHGVRWYVDDFGTGFSALTHLRDLPVHGLKLDKSFTSRIEQRESSAVRLAGGLAGLAIGLGLDTVAEGVETERQAATLRGQGWARGQGWLFGRPTPTPFGPHPTPTQP